MAIFDEMVDRKVHYSQMKFTRLLQYTEGQAKAAIMNCILVWGERGYHLARDILKEWFGNYHLVSQKIISDLKYGKSVSKSNKMMQLADDLSMALTHVSWTTENNKQNIYAAMHAGNITALSPVHKK